MIGLVARRFAGLILTLFIVSVLIFTVMDLLPGDPASIMLGTSASPDTLAALQRELGLDQPLPVRYLAWLGGVLAGDLGVSYTYGVPVAGLIAERLAGGFPGWGEGGVAAVKALVLPALALALPQAAVLTRVTRSAVLDVLAEDYIRTARAKGLSERAAVWRHALPAALVPIATMLGLQFTFLVAGAVLVENVFNLPGLGRLAFQALSQRDVIVMQDVILLFAALVIVVNFVADVAHLVLDPRLRTVQR